MSYVNWSMHYIAKRIKYLRERRVHLCWVRILCQRILFNFRTRWRRFLSNNGLWKRHRTYIVFTALYHTINQYNLIEAINGNYKRKYGPSLIIVSENKNRFRLSKTRELQRQMLRQRAFMSGSKQISPYTDTSTCTITECYKIFFEAICMFSNDSSFQEFVKKSLILREKIIRI